ncbi:chorismate mutase [Ancylobacter terrae]|uniref:chorismate mutase n=1 Tax=Ancylobacter sp. sgz301288 TaxID=3342077 RepID=UPI00385D4406
MSDTSPTALSELRRLRDSIDNIDAALIYILAERFKCTKQVGVLKAVHSLPPTDRDRERQQIARLRRLAEDAQFDPVFAEKFLNFIIEEVIRHHEAAAGEP